MAIASNDTPGRRRAIFIQPLAAAGSLLAGCGGGGGDAVSSPAGSAAPSSFAAGTIAGFGSVIVNGVRFDDSKARVSDDDGQAADASVLRLGMRVEIQGGAVNDDGSGPRAEAREIRFGSGACRPRVRDRCDGQSLSFSARPSSSSTPR
jgi:hypothetical protein